MTRSAPHSRPFLQRPSTLLALLLLLLAVTALLQFRWVGQLADLQGRQIAQALQRHNDIVARRFQRQISELLRRLDSASPEALRRQLSAEPTDGSDRGVAILRSVRALYLWQPSALRTEVLEITADAEPRAVDRADVPAPVRRAWTNLNNRRFGPPPARDGAEGGDARSGFNPETLRRLGATVFVDGPMAVRPVISGQGSIGRRPNRRFRPPQPSLLFVLFDRDILLEQVLGPIVADQIVDLPFTARFALIEERGTDRTGEIEPLIEVVGLFDDGGLQSASVDQQQQVREIWDKRQPGTSLRPLTGSRSDDRQGGVRRRETARERLLAEWYLVAAPLSGDLRAEVRTFRRRNLAVSLLVLGLLATAAAWLYRNLSRAERLAEQQNEFLAAITHELQTPLTAISTAGSNLADGVVQRPERVAEYGRMLQQEGLRLGRIVQQGLTLARGATASAQASNDVSCSLAEVVVEAIADQELLARTSGTTIEVGDLSGLPTVRGDHADWLRVIDNLIENAIKYGAENVLVVGRETGSGVQLDVVDDGPGIPPAEHDTVWQPFRRGARHTESNVPGTGLGLYLVRQLLERSGHRIALLPHPDDQGHAGHGTLFRIEARRASES